MSTPNLVTERASSHGRSYITPEDIGELLDEGHDPAKIRLDVLAVLGCQTAFQAEDGAMCAFVAWMGPEPKEAP